LRSFLVLRADVAAEVRAVHLDHAGERHVVVALRRRLTELVGQDENGLVLAVQIAGELEGADPLQPRIDRRQRPRSQIHRQRFAHLLVPIRPGEGNQTTTLLETPDDSDRAGTTLASEFVAEFGAASAV